MENFYYKSLQWLDQFLAPIDEPGSRLFHWNIIIALIIVYAWLVHQYGVKDSSSQIKNYVFNKKYWWNSSTKFDYKIYALNSILKVTLFIPFLDFSFLIAKYTARMAHLWWDDFSAWSITSISLATFTVLAFIWDDFLRFSHHLLMHKIPFLWKFHSVHHSAKVLTPVTLYRAHPIESAMATIRNAISLGVITGFFVFIFARPLTLWTILGVNVFGFLFNLLGANLRHSHIPIGFGRWAEILFISPRQHQIHHSSNIKHRDKNFGVSLSIWDKLMGSWVSSAEDKGQKLKFGLGSSQKRSFICEMGFSFRKKKTK